MAKRWEYIVKHYGGKTKDIQKSINRQIESGWELVNIDHDHSTAPQNYFAFRRELTKPKR